ncbi:hypothetical protein [Polaribacter sp. SA4-10]|nr:hypothetical protein [Polaribacter sp. SA4-10]
MRNTSFLTLLLFTRHLIYLQEMISTLVGEAKSCGSTLLKAWK